MAITKVTRHNTPAFMAYISSDSAMTQNVYTKIAYNSELYDTDGWSSLYYSDHTSKGLGYTYGAKVSSDNLNIRFTNNSGLGTSGFSRESFLRGIDGREPYVVSEISARGIDDTRWSSRSWPINRSLKDLERLGKYYLSPRGIQFILTENLKGLLVREGEPIQIGPFTVDNPFATKPQRFIPFFTGPLSTLPAAFRLVGGGAPNILVERDFPFTELADESTYTKFLDGSGAKKPISNNEKFTKFNNITSIANVRNSIAANVDLENPPNLEDIGTVAGLFAKTLGDFMTLQPIHDVGEEDPRTPAAKESMVESEKHGMPFYFKDLRDDTYIIFRGYISGLTENVSPSWTPQNYIGRSEPTWIYESAERNISFTLGLFAGNKGELQMIYKKLNKLTSLCYPEYKSDKLFPSSEEMNAATDTENEQRVDIKGKIRMKPPLTKFRMGELFGNSKQEMTGFIKSISYTYPDNSPWETEQGKRVPKYITATIGYQIIHGKVPELGEDFYGYVGV